MESTLRGEYGLSNYRTFSVGSIHSTPAQLFSSVWRLAVWWCTSAETRLCVVPGCSVGGQRRYSHQLCIPPEHWLVGAIPGAGVRLNRAGGMVVAPACHRSAIFPGQLCGTDCVLPHQQLWRLVWLAKFSAYVGRTSRMLYRRHSLLWAQCRQYVAVRVGFVWSI